MDRGPRNSAARTALTLLVALGLVAVVVTAWRALSFECDDAYINFRYVSNHMLGRGWTWNPEPFLPVEGYTAPLWLWTLRAVWTVTGVEAPVAAQWITMLASLGTLGVIWRMLVRMKVPTPFVVFTLFAIASQRVFVTWTSSGLETGFFAFLLCLWVFVITAPRAHERLASTALLAASAALVALGRPDGLLCVLSTLVLFAWRALRGDGRTRLRLLIGALPLLAVPLHLVWRKATYGEWLPNTYFAKHSSWWPESGARYAASYLVENGLWLWLVLALLFCVVAAVRVLRGAAGILSSIEGRLGVYAAVATLLAHFAYYSFAIGGDIFEYRVYAHTAALALASGAYFVVALFGRRVAAWSALLVLVAATHAFSWLHFAHEAELERYVPRALHGVLAEYRGWQEWLHARMVGLRRHRHAFFVDHLKSSMPGRDEGSKIAWDEARPVYVGTAAGVVGWCLPNVAIVDVYGLNDAVVARNPVPSVAERMEKLAGGQDAIFQVVDKDGDGGLSLEELRPAFAQLWPTMKSEGQALEGGVRSFLKQNDQDGDGKLSRAEVFPAQVVDRSAGRRMGHERVPPEGYVEGFRPNVRIDAGRAIVDRRDPPLRDAEIRAHEARFRARAQRR